MLSWSLIYFDAKIPNTLCTATLLSRDDEEEDDDDFFDDDDE